MTIAKGNLRHFYILKVKRRAIREPYVDFSKTKNCLRGNEKLLKVNEKIINELTLTLTKNYDLTKQKTITK